MQHSIYSPHNNTLYKTVDLLSKEETLRAINASHQAQKQWKLVPLEERKKIVEKFVEAIVAEKDDIATELAHLIGRFGRV